jgi:hypothetical protein
VDLVAWFLLLVVQNASFTWVSRARNSGSIAYHGVASVFSNGVWFVSQLFLIGMVVKPGMAWQDLMTLGTVYVAGTVTGAMLMHWASMRFLEKGKRKVGA